VTEKLLWAVASGGGIGLLPRGKATAASFAGALLFLRLRPRPSTQLLLVLVAAAAGQVCADHLSDEEAPDPQSLVLDEVAGVWLALLGQSLDPTTCLLGAAVFRALDKLKPWPISAVHGFGGRFALVGDDLAAGAIANVVLRAHRSCVD
jgi:phosphatidylglycerophosphatase A